VTKKFEVNPARGITVTPEKYASKSKTNRHFLICIIFKEF